MTTPAPLDAESLATLSRMANQARDDLRAQCALVGHDWMKTDVWFPDLPRGSHICRRCGQTRVAEKRQS